MAGVVEGGTEGVDAGDDARLGDGDAMGEPEANDGEDEGADADEGVEVDEGVDDGLFVGSAVGVAWGSDAHETIATTDIATRRTVRADAVALIEAEVSSLS